MIYFFPYLILFAGGWGLYQGGVAAWTGFIILMVVFPVFEFLMKSFKFNSPAFKSHAAKFSLYLTPLPLTIILFLALRQVYLTDEASVLVGVVFSAAFLLGGFAITSAHELVHRREKSVRALGVYNLMLLNFAHWGLEHVFGHHKYVATPLDPATARKNEWSYLFWFRSYFGGLRGAWHISKKRVAGYWIFSLAATTALYLFFGLKVVLSWWLISFIGIFLLETVDYIEHYGLVRPKNQDGNYMAFKGHHSWDSTSILTNITLFNLGFHSHHHMKAIVHFEDLIEQETARRMPYGYSIMIVMALVPWVYIPYMNQQLEKN